MFESYTKSPVCTVLMSNMYVFTCFFNYLSAVRFFHITKKICFIKKSTCSKLTYGLFGKSYIIASQSKFYLIISEIAMSNFKSIEKF